MKINFECQKCKRIFDCEVGKITIDEDSLRPIFENKIICPSCGERTIDEVFLTEIGQGQLTHATLDFDIFESDDDDDDDDFLFGDGFYEGECEGCDNCLPLNDLGLCHECAEKLERDLIRQRDWDYTAAGFLEDPADLEEIRAKVIKKYGEKLELIAPKKEKKKKRKVKTRKKRKGKK